MPNYEVVIDRSSDYIQVKADHEAEAIEKAIIQFMTENPRTDYDWWVAETVDLSKETGYLHNKEETK